MAFTRWEHEVDDLLEKRDVAAIATLGTQRIDGIRKSRNPFFRQTRINRVREYIDNALITGIDKLETEVKIQPVVRLLERDDLSDAVKVHAAQVCGKYGQFTPIVALADREGISDKLRFCLVSILEEQGERVEPGVKDRAIPEPMKVAEELLTAPVQTEAQALTVITNPEMNRILVTALEESIGKRDSNAIAGLWGKRKHFTPEITARMEQGLHIIVDELNKRQDIGEIDSLLKVPELPETVVIKIVDLAGAYARDDMVLRVIGNPERYGEQVINQARAALMETIETAEIRNNWWQLQKMAQTGIQDELLLVRFLGACRVVEAPGALMELAKKTDEPVKARMIETEVSELLDRLLEVLEYPDQHRELLKHTPYKENGEWKWAAHHSLRDLVVEVFSMPLASAETYGKAKRLYEAYCGPLQEIDLFVNRYLETIREIRKLPKEGKCPEAKAQVDIFLANALAALIQSVRKLSYGDPSARPYDCRVTPKDRVYDLTVEMCRQEDLSYTVLGAIIRASASWDDKIFTHIMYSIKYAQDKRKDAEHALPLAKRLAEYEDDFNKDLAYAAECIASQRPDIFERYIYPLFQKLEEGAEGRVRISTWTLTQWIVDSIKNGDLDLALEPMKTVQFTTEQKSLIENSIRKVIGYRDERSPPVRSLRALGEDIIGRDGEDRETAIIAKLLSIPDMSEETCLAAITYCSSRKLIKALASATTDTRESVAEAAKGNLRELESICPEKFADLNSRRWRVPRIGPADGTISDGTVKAPGQVVSLEVHRQKKAVNG